MDTAVYKFRNFLTQRRRPLLWTGGLLTLYALLGFLFVPWLAERQLVGTLQQRLGATAVVEDIDFNPFTFTGSVEGLKVDAAEGNPLLSLGRLYINLNPLRFLLLKLHIAEFTLDTPQLYYTRYSQTDDTITRLAQQWAATAEPEAEEEPPADEGLFPIELVHFQYLNGSIEYRDEVPQTDFTTTLGPLNLDVINTSTLEEAEQGAMNFATQIEQQATLTWNGNFDVSPVRFTGHLALANFSITTPYRYVQDGLPFVLRDGRVAFDLDYEFSLVDAAPQLAITSINVQLSSLDAMENGADAAFLSGGTLALENGSFLYPQMTAEAAALRIEGLNLALLRNRDGSVNLQAMLAALGDDQSVPVADDESATPLQLRLGEFALTDTTVNFSDQTTSTPVVLNLRAEAGLQNFTLAPDSALPFNVSVTLDSGGTLATMGTVQLFPALAVDTTLELADLALLPLQPYIDAFAQVTLENGSLALSAQLRTNATEVLSYQGDMTLTNLQLVDQVRTESLLSLERLHADNVDFSLSSKRADISELILDAFYGRVLIDENGVTNIGNAFSPAVPAAENAESAEQVVATTNGTETNEASPAAATETEAIADATPFAISLGRMQINGASSDFTDRSLPIVFDTKMVALNGEISGFSSTSSQAMNLRLEGQVDEYGLVEIMGALNPMDITEQTTIELAFSNLELPAMTPYVIKFAGREIAEGKADVTLQYTIDNSALQASNSITLRDLRLGGNVEYPDAMDLPLDLAVALLKNRDGVIDLNVPITGNVDDPQFSLGPVIRQAVFNVLGNIVTAPFRFLAGLIGGDSEEMERIRFRPGRSDLAPPEQEKLQKLQEALIERPQLALTIPAPLASDEDTLELQISAVNTRIEAQLAQEPSEDPLPERQLAVLENLYETALLAPTLEELRLQFTQVPDPDAAASAASDDDGDEEEVEPVFDAQAYAANLRERLIAAELVTEQMLQDLARARQQAVSAYLQTSGEVAGDRLQNQEVTSAAMEDGWLNAMFDVGVIE